jgi:hypothetical protein
MRSVVDRNVVMRRLSVFEAVFTRMQYVVHKEAVSTKKQTLNLGSCQYVDVRGIQYLTVTARGTKRALK